ncbi:hypothetical protein [Mesorhizobium sp. M00.F.Ca.ET.216.01.1.1]|uniref:hypothetical protein n=1 Tax=Mesorhizobium sp. M00.F.Ca.ET.216.01.1.1 TaxID=2500528 RepID=UPI000FD82B83|nr:hypothetical protein [Mesorhizobium sp. M00.F.Ca.ET.216.01.1.1]TGQ33381.1 hypothetical protein EN859_026760 [Mesorhizobium sp. M00.F.Ca.ET.216.01.1.1]
MFAIYESEYFAEHLQRNQQKLRTGAQQIFPKALPSRPLKIIQIAIQLSNTTHCSGIKLAWKDRYPSLRSNPAEEAATSIGAP